MDQQSLQKKLDKLPLDVVNYIYSFRPCYRIDMWLEKYQHSYTFLRSITTKDETHNDIIYHLFYHFFPKEVLHSVKHIEVEETDNYKIWYRMRDSTKTDELIHEVLIKLVSLYKDEKNHYSLFKLHLNYIVMAKLMDNKYTLTNKLK
jgi:hypothetical protein